jgi:hypothetical protein
LEPIVEAIIGADLPSPPSVGPLGSIDYGPKIQTEALPTFENPSGGIWRKRHNKASALRLTIGVTFEQKRPNQEHDDSANNGDELAVAHLACLRRP